MLFVARAPDAREAYARIAASLRLWPRLAASFHDAVAIAREEPIDVAVIEVDPPAPGLADAVARLRAATSRPWLVAVTGRVDADDEALRGDGFDGVLRRPFEVEQCAASLVHAVRRARSRLPHHRAL